MGAGKSSVAPLLARALELGTCDLDEEIAAETGLALHELFAREAEAGFRARERALLVALGRRDGLVVATGGGVVLDPANRVTLRALGSVVFLVADPDTQLRRIDRGTGRPLLAAASDPRAWLVAAYAARLPLYREVADLECRTDDLDLEQVVAALIARLRPT